VVLENRQFDRPCFVATFDDDGVPRATINFPRGNSGDPQSKHWDDTLEDWGEGRGSTSKPGR
jgi:penicillin amidase